MLDVLFACSFVLFPLLCLGFWVSTSEKRKIRKRKKQLCWMAKLCWRDFSMSNALKAYQENTIRANSNYIGKTILVTGKIQTIDKKHSSPEAIGETPFIQLSNYNFRTTCWMQESEERLLMEMQVGNEVNVYGRINWINEDPPSICLENCLILTTEEEQDGHQ